VVALVESAGGELKEGEALALDPSIGGLGLVKAGHIAVGIDKTVADLRDGRSRSALVVVSTLTPAVGQRVEYWTTQQPRILSVRTLRRVGASELLRLQAVGRPEPPGD
jgi:hypothetical protein